MYVKNKLFHLFAVLISFALLVCVSSCSENKIKVQAADLMEGVSSEPVEGKEIDEVFTKSILNFYFDLFKHSVSDEENSLISPLSVLIALSMTANGANGETLSQMEETLADQIPVNILNEYLYTYVKNLPSDKNSKVNIANSIWFRDDEDRLFVEKDFLQTNADYYNAAAYKSPFDNQTLEDINNWVNNKTEGMIDEILDEIRDDAVMYLINAIVFDAKWKTVYNKENIRSSEFTAFNGEKENVDFMNSEENLFISGKNFRGFIKPYEGDNYSFATFLPDEGIGIDEFIDSLNPDLFINALSNVGNTTVIASLPKFSYDSKVKMNDQLIAMGMNDAFFSGLADFSKLGRSSRGNIFIGEVLHKTFIAVDELGTKAGAVTKVEMTDEAEPMGEYVTLNRPFIYAIVDNSTNLPIFIGTVLSVS